MPLSESDIIRAWKIEAGLDPGRPHRSERLGDTKFFYDNGQAVGFHRPFKDLQGRQRVGMTFTHPEHRQKGHARKAVAEFLRTTTGPVFVKIAPENKASQATFKSLGFVRHSDLDSSDPNVQGWVRHQKEKTSMLQSWLPAFYDELEKLAAVRVSAKRVYRQAMKIPAGDLIEQGRQYRRRKKQKEKLSALSPAQAKELVSAHHDSPNWKAFEKNLGNQKFRQAVLVHPESDAKLKRYTKSLGEYKTSKSVVGVVPSRTSSKLYKIKELPNGRLACSCKDWQYAHSHKRSKSADCEHIREFKGGVQ